MSKLQEKITLIMDQIQEMMESNYHLKDVDAVQEALDKVSLYWAHMNDEDKDYVHCAREAVEEKIEWKP